MREIKFKTWVKSKKSFIKGCNNNDKELVYIFSPLNSLYRSFGKDDLIWLQFTGFKDKNDKEIYEGDILTFKYGVDKSQTDTLTTEQYIEYLKNSTKLYNGVVKWNQEYTGFIVSSKDCDTNFILSYVKDVSVTGNIFENLELLK